MDSHEEPALSDPKKRPKPILIISIVLLTLTVCGVGAYFLWLRPLLAKPLSASLDLEAVKPAEIPTLPATSNQEGNPGDQAEQEDEGDQQSQQEPPILDLNALQQEKEAAQLENPNPPLCGDEKELLILAVGIDYRGEDYLYGLGDVIRVIHVDYTIPQVNVVALPRTLLISNLGERLDVEGPILLNQGYLFGTPGMGHYAGAGYGGGSLAEVIKINFGLNVDHYVVFNFNAFIDFIDEIGGIEVDLPQIVDDRPYAYFPAGKQTLNGEDALNLARARRKYSDRFRIDTQTMIIRTVLRKLIEPQTLIKLPQLALEMRESVLTDVSPNQIQDAICLLRKMDTENINFYNPGEDLILADREYIPTTDANMYIHRWDSNFVQWLYDSLWATE
jgi:LCP family protein required for cell wall assembly